MYEKRVHIRIPVGLEGSYQPITRLEAPRLGMTRDISLGGARFASSERMEPGAKVSIVLSLPKEGNVTLTGLVIWSRMAEPKRGEVGYEAGLCWENVDVHSQARLNSFLIDYTRFDEPVIISSDPAMLSISWSRVLALGVGVAVLFGAAAVLWLRQYMLVSDNRSLQSAIQSYQHQIERFVNSPRS